MGIFCSYDHRDFSFVGYANSGYLSDHHKGQSQIDYMFLSSNAVISWCSTKQILVATSANHVEILALYEVGR